MLDAIGGRKFLLTLLVLALGTAVQMLSPKGVTAEYTALLVGVIGTFHASNAFITHTMQGSGEGDGASAPAPAAPDLGPLQAQLEQQSAAMKQAQEVAEVHSQTLANLQQGLELTQRLAKTAIAVKQG